MKNYILMLEHDAHDREVTVNYFRLTEPAVQIEFLNYSHEVFPYLESVKQLPALILVRINTMPGTGIEVLQQLKNNEVYKHIPVIVLGESTIPDWVKRCYEAGANTVINKPSTMQLTDMKIDTFIKYWFQVAELPSTANANPKGVLLN